MDYEKEKFINAILAMKFEDLHEVGELISGHAEKMDVVGPVDSAFLLLNWAKTTKENEEREQLAAEAEKNG